MQKQRSRGVVALLIVVGVIAICTPASAAPGSGVCHFSPGCVSQKQLKADILNEHIYASADTGYGRMNFTGWYLNSAGNWKPQTQLVNVGNPAIPPAVRNGETEAQAMEAAGAVYIPARRGFCWPWDDGFLSGSACWNNPATWNWPDLWAGVTWSPTPRLTQECRDGATSFTLYGLPSAGVARLLAGVPKAFLEDIAPEAAATMVMGSCAWQVIAGG